eukprot:1080673-Prorocentrum_minimum.AAC.1
MASEAAAAALVVLRGITTGLSTRDRNPAVAAALLAPPPAAAAAPGTRRQGSTRTCDVRKEWEKGENGVQMSDPRVTEVLEYSINAVSILLVDSNHRRGSVLITEGGQF